jgi:3-methyladenine DNA glycosylase AlkD
MLTSIAKELRDASDPARAVSSSKYFKTGKGDYGEGDVFIGLTVPQQRAIAKKYIDLPYKDIEDLLASHIHEFRMTGVMILVERFKAQPDTRKAVYEFYMNQLRAVNNWDLVDESARDIVGAYLYDKTRKPLYTLARSRVLWERRVAIVATHYFILKHQFADTMAIAKILIHDKHDLMHKAVGWMLREVAKQNKTVVESYLRKHIRVVPRTTLRYAIERFPEQQRKAWLKL